MNDDRAVAATGRRHTPADLERLSALLDEALDLPAAERAAWLREQQAKSAPLATTLARLLEQDAERETADFLQRPAFAPPDEAPAFAADDIVGPYRLLRRIGEGGMGEVWLAERADGQIHRQVALKLPMLGLRRSVLVQRFARERDILSALAHPHIARLYDAGLADDGQPYLALEHVDGRPITEHVRERGLSARATVQLMLQVMEAVQYAHANLVIHRDLKPSNVLVTAEGRAMLLDFGIAKLLAADDAQAGETELTRLGGRALTLGYAAPEQVNGAPVSIATDVWALGVLLYELLSGARPFGGERQALEQAILTADPARPGGLPGDLSTVLLKALKKAPAERYATVNAFAEDLQRWLDGRPVRAQADSGWYRLRKFVARNRLGVGVAAGVAATVLGASAFSVWQAGVAREQARIAQTEARTAAAVQDFLENIFKTSAGDQADPVKARQRTALQLLDEGAARVDKALEDAPQAKLRVLLTLATIYDDLGETERMAEMLGRRADVLDRLLPGALAERAQAHAELAAALAVVGRDADAMLHLGRAQAALATLPDADDDAHIAVDMSVAQFHAARGDARGLESARRLARRVQSRPPSLEVTNALMLKGKLERFAAEPALAVQTLESAVALAGTLPAGGENTLHVLLVELALAEADLGRPDAALQHLREAVRRVESNAGRSSPSTIITLARLGQLLTEQGRAREALEPLIEARRRIEAEPALAGLGAIVGPQRFHEGQARRRLGQLDEALRCYRDAVAASSGPDGSAEGLLRAGVGLALVLTAQGRLDEAQGALAQAQATRDRADLAGFGQLLMLAQAELGLALARGQAAQAAAAWRRFADDARTAPHRADPPVLALEAQVALASTGASAAPWRPLAGRPAGRAAVAEPGLRAAAAAAGAGARTADAGPPRRSGVGRTPDRQGSDRRLRPCGRRVVRCSDSRRVGLSEFRPPLH
jgi:serine/threonine-protein kinase